MDSTRQKWVTISFLAGAALVSFVFFSLSQKVIAIWDVEARYRNIELILRIASVVLAIGIFAFLNLHNQSKTFMDEAVAEFERVTWPTSKETSRATIVVMIMVILSSILLGAMDVVWAWAVKMIF